MFFQLNLSTPSAIWKRTSGDYMVRTDPGKVWKVTEFKVEIFQASKYDQRYEKVWKNPCIL